MCLNFCSGQSNLVVRQNCLLAVPRPLLAAVASVVSSRPSPSLSSPVYCCFVCHSCVVTVTTREELLCLTPPTLCPRKGLRGKRNRGAGDDAPMFYQTASSLEPQFLFVFTPLWRNEPGQLLSSELNAPFSIRPAQSYST